MYSYFKGTITEILTNGITLEVNNIGYFINVANPYSYNLNEEVIIYLYNNVKEDENSLYGFKNRETLELFLKLINVKGLGPKMALTMFATCSVSGIIDAIDRENILYLTKIPKIGDKIARQIILDLKGKLAKSNDNETNSNDELVSVLSNLGYKNPDIKKILPNINKDLTLEEQIKEALKLLMK